MYRRIDVLVEGRDDREFFNAVIRPILEQRHEYVQLWEYAGATIEKRIRYIKSIRAMNAEFVLVTDINASPCITEKKARVGEQHKGVIDPDHMIVVRQEIEGWYLAGLDDQTCQELGVRSIPRTDDVTKEQFRCMIPERFAGSAIDFMREILKVFRVDVAREKNRSFHYLMDRLEKQSGEA